MAELALCCASFLPQAHQAVDVAGQGAATAVHVSGANTVIINQSVPQSQRLLPTEEESLVRRHARDAPAQPACGLQRLAPAPRPTTFTNRKAAACTACAAAFHSLRCLAACPWAGGAAGW